MKETIKEAFIEVIDSLEEHVYPYLIVFFMGLKELFLKYVFSDFDFLGFLFVAMVVDAIAKMKALKGTGQFEWKKMFDGTMKKMSKYGLWLIICHVLVYYTVSGEKNVFFGYFESALLSILMAREAISVSKNLNFTLPKDFSDLLQRLAPSKKMIN